MGTLGSWWNDFNLFQTLGDMIHGQKTKSDKDYSEYQARMAAHEQRQERVKASQGWYSPIWLFLGLSPIALPMVYVGWRYGWHYDGDRKVEEGELKLIYIWAGSLVSWVSIWTIITIVADFRREEAFQGGEEGRHKMIDEKITLPEQIQQGKGARKICGYTPADGQKAVWGFFIFCNLVMFVCFMSRTAWDYIEAIRLYVL
ncbi:hypothetical protein BDZ45DRAFT_691134 [Acephala macrosclerotiorum]|nr:hypothetical protein BDZ45DRAFT_691134 [Acephala macrosclerotiorum]